MNTNAIKRRMARVVEQFEDWSDALDAAVELDRPIVAQVGREIYKCFPSRSMTFMAREKESAKQTEQP